MQTPNIKVQNNVLVLRYPSGAEVRVSPILGYLMVAGPGGEEWDTTSVSFSAPGLADRVYWDSASPGQLTHTKIIDIKNVPWWVTAGTAIRDHLANIVDIEVERLGPCIHDHAGKDYLDP